MHTGNCQEFLRGTLRWKPVFVAAAQAASPADIPRKVIRVLEESLNPSRGEFFTTRLTMFLRRARDWKNIPLMKQASNKPARSLHPC